MTQPLPNETSPAPLAPGQRLPESARKELSPAAEREIQELLARHTDPLSATLPALYIAQRDFGFLSLAAMREVARVLKVPEGHVFGVASFYTLFKKHPVGKYHLQVCTNLSCALNGGARILERACEWTGVKPGEGISADGLFSVEEVECLGNCGSGPCLHVNEGVYEEFVDEGKLQALLQACRAGRADAGGAR